MDLVDVAAPDACCFGDGPREGGQAEEAAGSGGGFRSSGGGGGGGTFPGTGGFSAFDEGGDGDEASVGSAAGSAGGSFGAGPAVELVSETTGEVVALGLMRSDGDFDDDDVGGGGGGGGGGVAGALLCADVRVPDIYSLRVGGGGAGGGGGGGGGRYRQLNWREPFEVSYHGPMLVTVEVCPPPASPFTTAPFFWFDASLRCCSKVGGRGLGLGSELLSTPPPPSLTHTRTHTFSYRSYLVR